MVMTERIIALRPHHIDRFVGYYHQFRNVFDDPVHLQEYGKKFAGELKDLFDLLSSGGTGEDYILVKNSLDFICHMCQSPRKRESCSDPDSLSIWNGSGDVMERMILKEGWLYPLGEFLEKVKQLYPNRNQRKE